MFIEVHQSRDASEFELQLLITLFEQLHIVEVGSIDGFINPLTSDFIKVNCRTTRNDLGATIHILADGVFVIRPVARQSDRDQEVLRVVANEIYYYYELFIRVFTKPTAKLLNKDNRRLRRPKHDNLVDGRNIDAFVEDIYREDVVESIGVVFILF